MITQPCRGLARRSGVGRCLFGFLAARIIVLPAYSAAPVAVDNAYTLGAGSPLVVAAAQGVSANDSLNGNVIEAVQVAAPAHGALTLNPDGSFIYAPQAAYSGDDSFTYRLRTVPGPLDFIIQQTESRIQIDANATTSLAGSATSKDDSRVGGLIKAVLSPGGAPFTQARITAVDAHLVDKVDLDFGFGCFEIFGCVATVGVHTRTTSPDWLKLSLEKAGPAAAVNNGVFSQPANSFRLKGVADVEAAGLADGLITPGPQTMDAAGEADLTGCQITASGSMLTLKMPVTYTGRFFFDSEEISTNYVDVTVRSAFTGSGGFIVGVAPASANVPVLSNVATVTLHINEANADGDSDGMPDAWESAHGLDPQSSADADSDPDGDGQSNRNEFLANTDPQDPSSVFAARAIAVANGSISLTFSGLDPTRRYQLQTSPNLVTWSDAGGLITPAGPTHTMTVPFGPDGQFHRLRVVNIVP